MTHINSKNNPFYISTIPSDSSSPQVGATPEKPFYSASTYTSEAEHWKMVRSAIEHEDEVTHQRLTWLLTCHAILFAAFGVVQTAIFSNSLEVYVVYALEVLLIVVFFCAGVISRAIGFGIAMAQLHNQHMELWWRNKYPNQKNTAFDTQKLWTFWFYKFINDTDDSKFSDHLVQKEDALKNSQPPIKGTFLNLPIGAGFDKIPLLFMYIDLVLIVVCVVIICFQNSYSIKKVHQRFELRKIETRDGLNTVVFDKLSGDVKEALPIHSDLQLKNSDYLEQTTNQKNKKILNHEHCPKLRIRRFNE